MDDLRAGCVTVLSLAVAEVIRTKTRDELTTKAALDAEIAVRVQARPGPLGRDGRAGRAEHHRPDADHDAAVAAAQALQERAAVLETFLAAGVPPGTALALLGPDAAGGGPLTGSAIWRKRLKLHLVEAPPPVAGGGVDAGGGGALLDEELGV